MPYHSMTFRKTVVFGALQGVVPWMIYGILECMFLSILPWSIKPNYVYTPLHLGFSSLLLYVIYPLIGVFLGGLVALALRAAAIQIRFLREAEPEILFPSAATLTVILVFSANLLLLPQHNNTVLFILFMSLMLTIFLTLSAGSRIRFERLRFLTNPWFICFTLLVFPWINNELLQSYPTPVKAISDLVCLVMIVLISFFSQKVIEARRTARSTHAVPDSPAKYFAFIVVVSLVVLGISSLLYQAPLIATPEAKSSPEALDRPNVILITMDTVRSDHLSLCGYERDTSSRLREFAKGATLYTHAIASGDMTLSSHASIFTGLYARRHGAHNTSSDYRTKQLLVTSHPLADKFQTIAEILSEKGYLTSAVVSNNTFLCPYFNLNQGFEYYDNRSRIPFLDRSTTYYLRRQIGNMLIYFAPPAASELTCRRAETINKEVFRLLGQLKKNNRPFFLFINYMDAHRPYVPPPPFDTLYPGKNEKFAPVRYYRPLKAGVMKLERKITEEERRHLVSQYDGEITYLDFHLGELITRLRDLGLYENSLIFITSDHGEMFGKRQLMEHDFSVYQGLVNVHLLIKYPNSNEGRVIEEFVSLVDIMPTILDTLGYEIPENVQGHSLLGLRTGESRILLSESFPNNYYVRLHKRFQCIERALFVGPLKFISSTAGKRELYDLSKDPDEKENLWKADNSVSEELEARLQQWLNTVAEEPAGAPSKMEKDTLDRLKSLGYIE